MARKEASQRDLDALIRELRTSYSQAEPRKVGGGVRPVLLVVDFIEGFTAADSPLAGSWDSEIAATESLLQQARIAGCPCVFTSVAYDPSEIDHEILVRKTPGVSILRKGSRWTGVDPRLSVDASDRLLVKPAASAFYGTPLASWLRSGEIDTVVICGCVTSGCVRATAVDSAQHGFRTLVVREAVADRSRLAHETNLMDIDLRYGDVVSTEEVAQFLEECGATNSHGGVVRKAE